MRCEVIGPSMEIVVRNERLASDVNVNLPVTEGDPPTDWWDADADKSLVIGVYKHGYERYNAIRADPCLCFLAKCGPPTSREDNPTGDTIDGEGREEEDSRDDPDYQLPTPQDRKVEDGESDFEEDFDVERKETPSNFTEQKEVKKPQPVEPLQENQPNLAPSSNLLPWPNPSELNTRLRRIVAGFQRILKREELKRVAIEKENKRKEKVEEAVRQKELKKAEQAQKWSKREEVDFYRCVSTYGVHINPLTGEYDWSKFRQMARLDKKNDARLSSYFKEFLAMCKRVCGRATDEEIIQGQNVETISEERANRCLRRVELMTSLRLKVLNHPELDERLKLAQLTPELPSWWQCKKHDKDLLIGVSKHGLTRTDLNILQDPELSFYELKSEMGSQPIAVTGNPPDLTSGSPESVPRSVNNTPVAFDKTLDRSVLEKIETLDSQDGSLDNQTFPVISNTVISPTASMSENGGFAMSDGNGEQAPPTYKQNYVQGMPPIPGSDALSSLVKQVSSLPSNPADASNDSVSAGEKRSEKLPPPGFMEGDYQDSGIPEGSLMPNTGGVNMNPAVTESLAFKPWWPKDRVVFHRVQQLCHLVVSGEWPSKPERSERTVDQSAPDVSVSPGAFQMFAESEMDGSFPGEPLPDPASKAFKVKKHEGLKVTLKKNRKRKKKDVEGLDGNGAKDSVMTTPYQDDLNIPFKIETPDIAAQAIGAQAHVGKPKKKRQRKEKADKPSKPPSEKKRRGRKPKAEKLPTQAAADSLQTALPSQPARELQDWAKGNNRNVYLPRELMNGPQESPIVSDVNMRRASIENQLDESRIKPNQPTTDDPVQPNTFRASVLKRTADTPKRDFKEIQRRLSSSSSHPDKPPSLFESTSVPPTNPTVVSPSATTPLRVSPYNNTEFPFGNNPYLNYSNYPNSGIMGYPRPPASTSPGFGAGFPAQIPSKSSAGSSPTSSTSTGSVGSSSQKSSTFVYDSPFPVTNPPNLTARNFGDSLGFNGFPSGLSTASLNYTKQLGLDDPETKVFNSDSENEQSEDLEDSDDEGIPLGPIPS